MNNISQRDAFWNRIYERARTDRNIVIVSADMGAPALDRFRLDLGSQFVNVGIAEQNAVTVAAGLVLSGKKVFTYAIAPFITLRCLEQIRVNSGIMDIPISFVGVGAGFGYEDSGPTHHIIEDLAIMRSMPNIFINSITDSVMAASIADLTCDSPHSNYIRLDRQTLPQLYQPGTDFSVGHATLREGDDAYIIATGCMTHIALDIANELDKTGISYGVIDLYILPVQKTAFLASVKGVKKLVVLEEHFLAGGLGSAVSEVLIDHDLRIPVKRLGLPLDKGYCYEYGGREAIRRYYGLGRKDILEAIRTF